MRAFQRISILLVLMYAGTLSASEACIPFSDAQKHIGANRCITEKVLQVKLGNGGPHPALPKSYDVERRGKFSAGRFSHPKAARTSSSRRQRSPPVSLEDPSLLLLPAD